MRYAEALAAEKWFGYGRWDAPYWFVGPEPGMAKREGDNLRQRCDAWMRLGSHELVDCGDHHRAFGLTKWHDRTATMRIPINGSTQRPPTQSTWRKLIALLLAFKGERTDNDAIGDYQAALWGSARGETCVAELSSLASHSLSTPREREMFRDERCALIRSRMLQYRPKFVVMYGRGSQMSYERIAGSGFRTSDYVWSGDTLCALSEHPTAIPGKPAAEWIEEGRRIREMLGSRSNRLQETLSISPD